jgi:hypothetical protein
MPTNQENKAMPVETPLTQSPSVENETQIYEKELLKDCGEYDIFFTHDPFYLNQYYQLRETSYREDNGWINYNGSENRFDVNGKIAVAVKDNDLIGGIRVNFSNKCGFLSNEIPGTQYEYRRLIEKYDKREGLVFSEASALAIRKDFRKSEISTKLFEMAFEISKKNNINYIFAVAVATVCRNDRRTAKRLGYDGEIVINYPWEKKSVYNYQRMFPMYSKLS